MRTGVSTHKAQVDKECMKVNNMYTICIFNIQFLAQETKNSDQSMKLSSIINDTEGGVAVTDFCTFIPKTVVSMKLTTSQ